MGCPSHRHIPSTATATAGRRLPAQQQQQPNRFISNNRVLSRPQRPSLIPAAHRPQFQQIRPVRFITPLRRLVILYYLFFSLIFQYENGKMINRLLISFEIDLLFNRGPSLLCRTHLLQHRAARVLLLLRRRQ